MKSIASITLGAALLLSGLAFAQTPAPDSSSSNSDISQSNAPANNAPSKATDANGGTTTPEAVAQACDKQADDKNLSGDNKTSWVKKCKMGKTTRQDH